MKLINWTDCICCCRYSWRWVKPWGFACYCVYSIVQGQNFQITYAIQEGVTTYERPFLCYTRLLADFVNYNRQRTVTCVLEISARNWNTTTGHPIAFRQKIIFNAPSSSTFSFIAFLLYYASLTSPLKQWVTSYLYSSDGIGVVTC
jgi:hypothetical protein